MCGNMYSNPSGHALKKLSNKSMVTLAVTRWEEVVTR